MTLIQEIGNKIEAEIRSGASLKERLFYHFLTGTPNELQKPISLSDIDKVCINAFSTQKIEVKDICKKIRASGEIRGMHYSKNLIELIAMGLENFELERNSLKNYSDKGTLKESFLINKVFPEINIQSVLKIEDEIDELISLIFIKKEFSDVGNGFSKSLANTCDLTDLTIINLSINEAWSNHPNRGMEKDLNTFIRFHKRKKEDLYFKFKLKYTRIGRLFFLILSGIILLFVIKFWDTVEPLLAGLGVISALITFTLSALSPAYPHRFSKFKNWFDKIISEKVSLEYSKLGINLNELNELENKYCSPFRVTSKKESSKKGQATNTFSR